MANKPFIPVYLACDPVQHLLRDQNKTLVTVPLSQNEVADDIFKYSLFRFPDAKGTDINITTLAPEEAARIIQRLAAAPEEAVQTKDSEEEPDWIVVWTRNVTQSEL